MSSRPDVSSRTLEIGLATRTRSGESQTGDAHLVKPVGDGVVGGGGRGGGTLIAVTDGLGHGAEAADAARKAIATLERHAGKSVLTLMQQCHAALIGTRGVVLTLAYLDSGDGTLTWAGVGNVDAVLLYGDGDSPHARATLVTRGGIVGSELPPLRAEVLSFSRGDTLIIATDGIRSGFADALPPASSCQDIADHILEEFDKGSDDALVLVVRPAAEMRPVDVS